MFRSGLAVAVLGVLTLPALANGAISEFPAGGVVFKQSADIAIAREDLYLSVEQVRVRYEYRSDAAETQHLTIGFPMPPVPIDSSPDYMGGGSLGGLNDLRNYMEFEVSVGGEPIEAVLHEYASFNDKDVTARLQQAGVPVFLSEEDATRTLGALDDDVLNALVDDGLVALYGEADAPDYIEPLWLYQTVFEWQQDFAPGETVVEIAYRPLTGAPGDFGDRFEVGPEAESYCVDDAMRSAIDKRRDRGSYEPSTLSYIVKTGRYWKGPIGQFNVIVDKANSFAGDDPNTETLVAFCPLDARKISDTQWTWSKADYEPDEDIKVVFYHYYFYPED